MRVSVGASRHKVYLGKWNTWLEFMKKKGRGSWLNLLDKSEVLTLLLEIHGLSTVFIFDNQQSTVRGYLAAITFFHKLYLGWELTTSHYMIAAAGKGTDSGDVRKNAHVRLPLTWSILAHEYLTVTSSQEGGDVLWLGLALSYFLLCRASVSTIGGGGDTTIPSPGMSPKQPLPGIGLRHPHMVGKLAPNSTHFTKGLVNYIPGRRSFRAVPSQNGDKFVSSPPPPQSLNRSSVRTVRVREWARVPGFLFDARLPDCLSWRCSG